ncbi:MAG: hypothetical protein R3C44_14445 [Chloroflexota bacterium]
MGTAIQQRPGTRWKRTGSVEPLGKIDGRLVTRQRRLFPAVAAEERVSPAGHVEPM